MQQFASELSIVTNSSPFLSAIDLVTAHLNSLEKKKKKENGKKVTES